jgi:hypothetical protein
MFAVFGTAEKEEGHIGPPPYFTLRVWKSLVSQTLRGEIPDVLA